MFLKHVKIQQKYKGSTILLLFIDPEFLFILQVPYLYYSINSWNIFCAVTHGSGYKDYFVLS